VLPTGRSHLTTELFKGIAAVLLCFYAATHIPVIGFFVSLLIPPLVLFHRLRFGRRIGAVVPVVSGAVMTAALDGASFEMLFFFELMVLGFVLGEMFEKNLSIERTVIQACAVVTASGAACLIVYSGFAGTDPMAMVSAYVDRNLQMTVALYQSIGLSEEMLKTISESLEMIRDILVHILPALVIASVLFATWAALIISKPLTRRYGLLYPDFGRLNLWKAPDVLVWGVIGGGIALLIPVSVLRMAGANVLIVLMTVYFFSGIAIVSYYLEKKRFPLFFRVCVYSFIALQQIVFFLVIGIGFFDTWLNFRKLETYKE